MDFLRTIWPSWADIERTIIKPSRHDLWEQRAIGVYFAIGGAALYGALGWRLVRFLLGVL